MLVRALPFYLMMNIISRDTAPSEVIIMPVSSPQTPCCFVVVQLANPNCLELLPYGYAQSFSNDLIIALFGEGTLGV